MATLGQLKKQAKAAGISMNAVCVQAGVPRSTPWRWGKKKHAARAAKMQQLHDALAELIAART